MPTQAPPPPHRHTAAPSAADSERIEQKWVGRAARLFCLGAGILIVALLVRYALPCIVPFLLAWLLSFPIRRGARIMERRLHLSRRIAACLLLLALLLPLGALGVLLIEHTVTEAQQLLTNLGSGEKIISALEHSMQALESMAERIPLLSKLSQSPSSDGLRNQLDSAAADMITQTLSRWSAELPELLSSTVRRFPTTLVFVLTFLLALFYCCTDDGRIGSFVQDAIPPLWRPRWQELQRRTINVVARYLRAYLLLFVLTFMQLLIGLSVLGIRYVFLPALLISLLDILPVLGVGTVLLPWGILSLLGGNTALGTGLLILCAVMMLLRQLLEPRIIGDSIGLHPLATLIAIYAGLRLAGIWGMVAAPMVAVLLKSLLDKKEAASLP